MQPPGKDAAAALAGLYISVPTQFHDRTQVWMSRATLAGIAPDMMLNLTLVTSQAITIFGMRVMIDDRMPLGLVKAEMTFDERTITGSE